MQVSRERVLLVDDEPQILLALEDLLGDLYTIFKTDKPERALDLVSEDREIAVVITDQRMPNMNGDEFLRRISGNSRAIRIMVSGFADLPAVLRAVNEGKVFAYVTKPWDEDDLRHKVQTAVEHFRLSQQLDYERRLLRDLMDNSPDGIYFKDAELRFLRANEPLARLLGRRTADELVGLRLSDLLDSPDEIAELDAEERLIFRAARPIQDIVRKHGRTGRPMFTSETKAPIRNLAGEAIGLVGISRDVTERVEISEALRQSEAALQRQTRILNSILDGMGDGVVVTARDGRTLICNREASRVLGVSTRNVRVEAWPEAYGLYLLDGRTLLPAGVNPLLRAMNGESLVQMEVCINNSLIAGSIVAITATPLKDATGAVVGAIKLLRDVTAQRNLEQQLAQSQKMEAIGQLAGGVAHDFNNLLTVIVGCSELVLEEIAEGDGRRNVAEVLAAARRGSLLTQQLLAFSRRQIIEPKELQLNEIVTGIESMLGRLIGGQILISTVLRPELGLVTADKSQLEQIIVNLAVNARDAMPEGGVLRIETDETLLDANAASELGVTPGRFVVLTFTDTGQGMSEETRRRLFEPFFTTKEIGKGTGLGLSTVYGIVRQSKGHIRVLSAPGEGTEFRILLPRSARDRGQTDPSIPPEPQGPPITATILLLEEESAVCQIAARILRSEGHTVLEAACVSEALALLRGQGSQIEMFLADVSLLESNGESFLAELTSGWPRIGVAFMSGGGPAVGVDAISALGDGVLVAKPFSRRQLLERVQSVVRGRRLSVAPSESNVGK